MANPQKEDGYTAIANEILDALALFRIPGECRQVFDYVLRKTYGFQKKQDCIANSQIVKGTGMKKQNVSRSLAKLINNKLVIKTDDKCKDGNILMINKDYSSWIPFVIKSDYSTKSSSEVITTVIRSDDKASSEVMDTKEKRKYKRNNTAKRVLQGGKPKVKKEVIFTQLGAELLKEFEVVDIVNKTYYGNKTQRAACDFLIDSYGFELVKKIITVLPKTNLIPFFPEITTPDDLKKKWVKLKNSIDKEKTKSSMGKTTGISNYIFTN